MSKQRYIRDSFWTDSYVERLTPDEKLIFLYLLTNALCNVAGIYEVRSKRIGFDTGYDMEVVENVLKRFEKDKKLLRHNDWIIIVNHIKNQSLNPSIIQGIQRIVDELPLELKEKITGWVQAGLLNSTLLNLTLPTENDPAAKEVKDIFDYWNLKKVTVHKKLTVDIKSKIKTRLKEFSIEDIKKGIDVYAEVYHAKDTWWTHKWSLSKFISQSNGMQDFYEKSKSDYIKTSFNQPSNIIHAESSKYDSVKVSR